MAQKRDTNKLSNLLYILVSFAAGTLLATALFDLIPGAIEMLAEHSGAEAIHWVFAFVCLGYLGFFLLERFSNSFHHHHGLDKESHKHSRRSAQMIIIGDSVHTLVDGAVIGLGFAVSFHLGAITLLAILAHKIPQEISDFALLVDSRLPTKKAFMIIATISLSAIPAGILAYFLGGLIESFIPYLLAITAGFFLYISASDVIPEIHEQDSEKVKQHQTIALILGTVLIALIINISHSFIGH